MVTRAVLVPPDLHLSAGVVVRDRLREGCIAQAQRLRVAGAWVDLGDRGETAQQTALRVREAGVGAVELLVPATHRRAARLLRDALLQIGLDVTETLVDRVEAGVAEELWFPRMPDSGWFAQWQPLMTLGYGPQAPERVADERASPFSPAVHLGDDDWLDALTARVAILQPRAVAEWTTLRHAHDACVHPLEAIYAGLHLRERNAELLVNIL